MDHSEYQKSVRMLEVAAGAIPEKPEGLSDLTRAFPLQRECPVPHGGRKRRNVWVGANLLEHWWQHKNDIMPSSAHYATARQLVERMAMMEYLSEETDAYITTTFGDQKRVEIHAAMVDMVVGYGASLAAFIESLPDGSVMRTLCDEARAVRMQREHSPDTLLFLLNFVLVIPDLYHLYARAHHACVANGVTLTQKEGLVIADGLMPLIMRCAAHHNVVTGEVLRFLLGEGGLRLQDALVVIYHNNRIRFVVSDIALQHIARELRIGAAQAHMFLTSDDACDVFDEMERMYTLSAKDPSVVISAETKQHYMRMYRSYQMARAASGGVESVGCPLLFARDGQGENVFVTMTKSILTQMHECLLNT